MKEVLDSTISRIFEEAKKEFLEKGFKSASLRNIVKSVGMTTGAFYGYYKSKEDLFEALVEKEYQYIIESLTKTLHNVNSSLVKGKIDIIEELIKEHFTKTLHYGYEHLDAIKLLLLCSDGTKYENILDKLVEIQESCAKLYKDSENNKNRYKIDERLEHVLVTGMFYTYAELFIHEMPIEKAEIYLNDMLDFYMAGWKKLQKRE